MDLEQLRNFSFISTPVSIFFLVISIVAFSNGEIGGIIFLFGAIFMLLPFISYLKRKSREAKPLASKLTEAKQNFKNTILDIRESYMILSVSDADIDTIVDSPNPFATMQSFVCKENPITPLIFQDMMQMQWCLIMEDINYPIENAQPIYDYISLALSQITQANIDNIAKEFSKGIPAELHFLRGRINYRLACLGIIMQYANEQDDIALKIKINNYRSKKGYT